MNKSRVITAAAFMTTVGALASTTANAGSRYHDYRYYDDLYRVVGVDGSSRVQMHARPRSYSAHVGSLPFNARYLVKTGSRHRGRWIRINYRGLSGWVRRTKLARDLGGRTYFRVTGLGRYGKLEIHARPHWRSWVRGYIPNHARFIVDLGKCRGTWCKIAYRGTRGWVKKHCLISMRRTDPPWRRDRYRDLGRYDSRLSRYQYWRNRTDRWAGRWDYPGRRSYYRTIYRSQDRYYD
jgi:SH3-like domain-containing protein